LELGRTSLTNAGLRRFKLGWGTTEKRIGYSRWKTGNASWLSGGSDHSGGLHTAVFAKLPSALSRFTGTFVYPHLD
jgi:hypothetical protein